MIEALVRRGFLVRRRVEGDRKRRELALTKFGRRALRCAFHKLVRSGLVREMVERAIELDVRECSADQLRRSVAGFDASLLGAGFSWSDRALLDYPPDARHAPPTAFVSEPSYLDSAPDLSELLVRHGYLDEEEVNAFYASL